MLMNIYIVTELSVIAFWDPFPIRNAVQLKPSQNIWKNFFTDYCIAW